MIFAWLVRTLLPPPRPAVRRGRHHVVGRAGEDAAAAYLRRGGMAVTAVNWTCDAGEIDVICRDGVTVVYVEVKTNAHGRGEPEVRVDAKKRCQVRRAAKVHAATIRPRPATRFDVVGVVLHDDGPPTFTHIRDAFGWREEPR